jgi:hypothetical protein
MALQVDPTFAVDVEAKVDLRAKTLHVLKLAFSPILVNGLVIIK